MWVYITQLLFILALDPLTQLKFSPTFTGLQIKDQHINTAYTDYIFVVYAIPRILHISFFLRNLKPILKCLSINLI